MSDQPTKIDLNSARPPQFAEEFRWSLDHQTQIVTAIRPGGAEVRSEAELADKRNRKSPMLATHTLQWEEICTIAIHAKNAFDFIWRINRTAAI